MPRKNSTRYTEEFKKTIVNLHQNGKSYAEIEQEYGVSHSALAKCIKQYSVVKPDDDTLITAEQIKAFTNFTTLCARILITMGFRPLRLRSLLLSSQLFSVYFIDIGPVNRPYVCSFPLKACIP